MFDQSFSFPKELLTAVPVSTGRVAVIGAGIAGLVSAYELQRRGLKVVLYERANRPGGRIHTFRFWDGSYADVGAMRIPGNHHCVLHYVTEFGLRTRPFVNFNPDAYYYLRGRRARVRDAHALYPAFALRPDKQGSPMISLDQVLRAAWETISTKQQQMVLEGRWDDPALDQLMSISLWQFVRQKISEDAWDLLGHASGLVHYEHASLIEVLVDYFSLFHVAPLELVGGMDCLVRRFVDRLHPDTLQLSTRTDELRLTSRGVRVTGERFGLPISSDFDFVVCCVPLTALDQIAINPGLPYQQTRAIRSISYASSTKTLVHTKRRSWELEDGIFGGGSFTDLPIQQCWYPSDNARPDVSGSEGQAECRRLIADEPERSHDAGVLIGAYLWGSNARHLATLPKGDRDRLVLKSLEKLHPGILNDIDDIVHWNWDEQVGMGGGAFAYLAPGEHARYLTKIGNPHPADSPRIFFAGEHVSVAHAWIQGAAQSALCAVSQVLGCVGRQRDDAVAGGITLRQPK